MKRIFPIIVILITLSLGGLFWLQISWFKNMLILRREQILAKVEEAGFDVAMDLSAQASSAPTLKRPNNQKFGSLLSEEFGFGLGRPTISQNYSFFEINEKLQKRFEEKGLKNVQFEFAITSNSNLYNVEMQSKNFFKESEDTVHNKTKIFAINPQNSQMEGVVPFEHLFVIVPDFKTQVWGSLQWVALGSLAFSLIIITAFALTVHTLLRQKKLSEIKTDFINNMTHEFKTPLATISLAVDALKNEKVMNDPTKRDYFNNIIKEENKRMNKHVETILQAALMDKQEIKLNLKPLHVHDMLQKTINNFQLQLHDKQAVVELMLNAKHDLVEADEVHFGNVLNNLVDNAIKYSKDTLTLKILTYCTNSYLVIKVDDNGIGMNKETVKRVFEKFYRAHTGNLHNIKGFGLGMSYVKRVVDEHKGKIRVESTLGKGSCFTIEMPRII